MKRKFLTVLLAIVAVLCLCFGLAACGTFIPKTPWGGAQNEENSDAHTHSYTEYVSDGNATCTADGTETAHCDHEGCTETDTRTATGSKLGHLFVTYVSDGNATCTADGTETAHCSHAGCTETDTRPKAALGHNFETYVSDGNVTCAAAGTETAHCSHAGCTETDTRPKAALGHNFATYVSNGDATCTTDGTETAHCTRCTETDTRTVKGSRLGHNFETYVSNGDATCTENGTETATCTRCTETDTREAQNSAGHQFESFAGKPATCAENGYSSYRQCRICSHIEGNEVIPALHVEYSIGSDSYEVVGLSDQCTHTEIVLPDTYYGLPVTSIGDMAFIECSRLKSITIPDSVTEIGDGAFNLCIGLTSVTIGSGVTGIGKDAFWGCWKLIEVWNYSQLKIIEGDWGNGFIAGYAKHVYTEETPGIQTVKDDHLFYEEGDDVYLLGYVGESADLTLPTASSSGKSYKIYNYAFYDCDWLTSVTIEDGVTEIEEGAFYGCSGLKRVNITDLAAWCKIDFGDSAANPLYYAHHLYLDNVEVKDLTIPAEIKEIKQYAFYGCSGLTSVTIGSGVAEIGSYAFSGSYKLIEVWNYSGLTFIEGDSGNGGIAQYAKHIYTDDTTSKQILKDDYLFYEEGDEAYLLGYMGESADLTLPATSPSGKSYKIWQYAFYDCDGLTSVTIGSGVKSIGEWAFCVCSGLTSVTIGDSVKSIRKRAFSGCSGLKSVTIGSSVTSIESYAFYECRGLERINITDLAAWCKIEFGDHEANPLKYAHHLYLDNVEVKDLTIPAEITKIKDCAFFGCYGLTSIEIPDSVTSIGNVAFYNCSGLESVTIGNGVTKIGEAAFDGCTGLESVYYKGTPAGWSGIQIDSDNGNLTSATRYYFSAQAPTEEQWEESENWWHYDEDGETIILWTKEA